MLPCRPAGQKLTEKHIFPELGGCVNRDEKNLTEQRMCLDKNGVTALRKT